MLGILAIPSRPAQTAVIIVLGGPQYRIGSHRQFVRLARALAEINVVSLRFDFRGIGDSEGHRLGFSDVQWDIRASIDMLFREVPSISGVVLWGLCDGATASALYAHGDRRVVGLALFNPWVRTSEGEARVLVRHYYARRLLSVGFWSKLFRGEFGLRASISDLRQSVRRAFGTSESVNVPMDGEADLPTQVGRKLLDYQGPLLCCLSGNDRVAQEFKLAAKSGVLRDALRTARARLFEFPRADHTFSSGRDHDQMVRVTIEWLVAHAAYSFHDIPELSESA
jgi:exosortase A-associated hydrolase 1